MTDKNIVVEEIQPEEIEANPAGYSLTESGQRNIQALADTPAEADLSPLISACIDGRLDPDKLERLLEVQTKYEVIQAKKAYHAALAAFKAHAPILKKNQTVAYGDTKYHHVGLGYALTEISPVLSEHGLSLSYRTTQKDGQTCVKAILTHSHGHSDDTELCAAPDASGGKNGIQSIASAVTYLKRHTAFALLGLEGIDDDDGQGYKSDIEYITEQEEADLLSLIEEIGVNSELFLKVLKLEEYGLLPKAKLAGAIARLEKRRNTNA